MPEIDDNDYRIHLILGITGHRDIPQEDVDKLKEKIKEIFNELKGKYPHTPLLLLTPLAEGADRIAAKAAIEEGIDYVVVLPFPEEEYVKDFPESKDEYYDLRDKEKHKNLKGIFSLEDKIDDDAKKYGPERDKLYENVGAYIARHSQILIALWDGKEGKRGGTSEVIKFKLKGLPHEYHPHGDKLDKPDTGPVYIVYTRRKGSDSHIFTSDPHVEIRYPENSDSNYFTGKNDIFKRFDTFNAESEKLKKEEIKESREDLADGASDKEKFVSYIFAKADVLAKRYKKAWQISNMLLIALGLLTTLIFVIYFLINNNYLLLIYGILFTLFAIFFKFLNIFHGYHQKYVDYRVLAEGLRILFFMRMAGLHEYPEDYYLKKHRINFRWGRDIIRSANIFDPQPDPDFPTIEEYWINTELDFYRTKVAEKNRKLRIYKNLSLAFFSSSILMILITIVFKFMNMDNYLIILFSLIVVLPVISGAFETYISRNDFTYISKQYSIMKDIFERATDRLKELDSSNVQNIREKQSVIRELLKEAARENADWMLMHTELREDIRL
jgi:hypothetical protein